MYYTAYILLVLDTSIVVNIASILRRRDRDPAQSGRHKPLPFSLSPSFLGISFLMGTAILPRHRRLIWSRELEQSLQKDLFIVSQHVLNGLVVVRRLVFCYPDKIDGRDRFLDVAVAFLGHIQSLPNQYFIC
jgi:hypothetical protein